MNTRIRVNFVASLPLPMLEESDKADGEVTVLVSIPISKSYTDDTAIHSLERPFSLSEYGVRLVLG